jgi:hypothetical protein
MIAAMPFHLRKKVSLINVLAISLVIPLLSLLMAVGGCAKSPAVYIMNPSALEAIRSGLATVCVSLSPEPSETDVLLPAKGAWGGIKRGFVFGATTPVMLGFVSPVPGGTYIGLLASPFSAIAGGFYGAFTAVPAEEVEHAEAVLEIATDKIRRIGLSKIFVKRVVDLGNSLTNSKFVVWPGAPVSSDIQAMASMASPPIEPIDARLQVRVEKTGLRGSYRINPQIDTFIRIHVQLIRSEDHAILLDEHYTCTSDEERTFDQWAHAGGTKMIDEFRVCVPELAEKIIDDFFRVYPLEWRYGDPS